MSDAGRRVLAQLIEAFVYEGVLAPHDGRIDGRDDAGNPVTYVCRTRRTESFDRVRVEEPVVRIADGAEAPATDAARFLREAGSPPDADPRLVERLAEELARTARNDASALTDQRERGRLLRDRSYEELEGALPDGHRYHPTYKSRIGFTDADNRAYGPEFEPTLRPLWVEMGGVRLPVHPWQWREHGPAGAILIGESEDEYRPQQSIRTLWNVTSPEKPCLKLSLGIVNTSTGRLLAPHTVANAPLVSDWLHGIIAGDDALAGTVALREIRGVSAPPFGCIWRESLRPHLAPGEDALPFTGLVHRDLDGEPLIARWIEAHGCEAWLRRLLEVSVVPLVHLLCAHGIALEAHAQNIVLIHADGWPRRVALRDFHDGVRFSAAHLADPGARPPLHATPPEHARVNRNSYIETDDPLDVRDFVHDAFFFVNLSELALFAAGHLGLPERRFWTLAREVVLAHRERHPELRDRFARFDVLAPRVRVEQLAKRRLYPDDELRLQEVRNPLAEPDRVARAIREATRPVCLYVYDLAQLRDHVRRTRAALPPGCRLLYAMKANSEAPLLEAIAPLIDGFEAASLGEVQRARAAAPGAYIAFGGPAKTDAELEADVDVFHLESATELLRAEHAATRTGRTLSALIRVNVSGPLPEAMLRMSGQFGVDEDELPDVLALARRCPHVEIRGLHFHSISNNLDADAHADLVARYLELAAEWEFTTINAGGGIGVDYAQQRSFDWARFTARLATLVGDRTLVFECGRYLTAACGAYAAEVLDLKRVHGTYFALVRGGTHHLRLPASWQHSHPFRVLPLDAWDHPFPRPELRDVRLTVAGQLCSPKDVLARDVPIERVRVGDVLVFQLAGAYGWSISHHDFLSHPHPDVAWLGREP